MRVEKWLRKYFFFQFGNSALWCKAAVTELLYQNPFLSTPLTPVVWGSLRPSEQFLMYQMSSGPQQSRDKTAALRVPITAILSGAVFLCCKCILKDWQIHLCLDLL